MTSARPHAPSSDRIAEARASGHVPRAPLVGFGVGVLGLVGYAGTSATSRYREPLELAARGDVTGALERASTWLLDVGASLATALFVLAVAIAASIAVAQGPAFARLTRTRVLPPPLRPSRTASVLWCLCLGALVARTVLEAPMLTIETLRAEASAFAWALVLITVACIAIDVAFARARFYASLWMTRREFLDEQRESHGAPELRSARARARDAR